MAPCRAASLTPPGGVDTPPYRLLTSFLRRLLFAQFAAQDLADIGLRQRIAELDVARDFVAGHALPGIGDELGAGQRIVLAHDDDLDRLPRLLVGDADRADLEYAGMGHQYVFDLVGVDVEPGDIDHVLLAVDHEHIAALVDLRDVARAQETVGVHHVGGLIGHVPVAGHDLRAFDA